MSAQQKQLTLFVTFQVAPESIDAWLEAHRPVWAACAKEPECLLFDVFQDPQSPGKFRLVEVWSKDREWFEKEQLTKPYYQTLWEKTERLYTAPSEPTDYALLLTYANQATNAGQIEFFERFGEGCIFRDGYLAAGTKVD
ncbi:MAG: hypothetical protein M1820_001166 [Bogoriella megaspora]|nr:MAG: hypothetical protein M1820_001166 [Bogoriella megaspora]